MYCNYSATHVKILEKKIKIKKQLFIKVEVPISLILRKMKSVKDSFQLF